MKLRLLAPVLVLSAVACGQEPQQAALANLTQLEGDVRFECVTIDKFYGAATHKIVFTVRDADATLAAEKGDVFEKISDDDGYLVEATPEDSKLNALNENGGARIKNGCLLYTSPSPRDS